MVYIRKGVGDESLGLAAGFVFSCFIHEYFSMGSIRQMFCAHVFGPPQISGMVYKNNQPVGTKVTRKCRKCGKVEASI